MALFAAARRAAAASVPLLRASASGAPRCTTILRSLAAVASPAQPCALPFSSAAAAAKRSSDADLVRVIDSEIKYAEECDDHDRVEEIPENFPFKIHDEKGMDVMTLTRTYQGEQIKVLVSMPSIVTGDDPEHDQNEDNEERDEDEEGEGEKPQKSSIPLTVTVTKGDGPSLEFTCTAYPDEIIIDTLSVKQPSVGEEEMIAYEGPDFNDLDENLQRAFHKYLELRGITPMATNFLHEYMINKDSREFLFWLRKLKDFVKQ